MQDGWDGRGRSCTALRRVRAPVRFVICMMTILASGMATADPYGRGDPSDLLPPPATAGWTQQALLTPKVAPRSDLPECVPPELRAQLREIERRWGKVNVISTHRPGARVRNSGRPSLHASCRAIDFRPAKGTYGAVARWLKDNHRGGVGTYSGRHNHIHIDNGPCRGRGGKCIRWHN